MEIDVKKGEKITSSDLKKAGWNLLEKREGLELYGNNNNRVVLDLETSLVIEVYEKEGLRI